MGGRAARYRGRRSHSRDRWRQRDRCPIDTPSFGPAGRLTFIDRSPVAIGRATARNRDDPRFVAVEGDIAGAPLRAGAFDKIFAVNVNVFWTGDAVDESGAIRRVLRPRGILLLVYDVPNRERLDEIGDRVKTSLTGARLTAELKVREDGPLLAVMAGRL